MTRPGNYRSALLSLLLIVLATTPLGAQTPGTDYTGASRLGLELRRLGTTQRVLMIGAHPDDENTAVLATLALGSGAEVAYLSLTRGEGGQNGIGVELQEALGLIRTEELLSARRLDGARQYFTRAYDYGFSKSAAEAFSHWPADSLLADAVAVVRQFRPDIIVSIFAGTPADGHGQHQAAGIIAHDAFTAAGDPSRFPDQFATGLRPHQPTRLYRALWRGGGQGYALQTGIYDPLLGHSYHELATLSRSRHRSQDMGRALVPGPQEVIMQRVDRDDPGGAPLFEGLDTTLSARARSLGTRLPQPLVERLIEYDELVPRIRREFNPLEPSALVPELTNGIRLLESVGRELRSLSGPESMEYDDLLFHINAELDDLRAAVQSAAGIIFDVVSGAERVTPGQSFKAELTIWNGGPYPLRIGQLEPMLPAGWRIQPIDPIPLETAATLLEPGALLARRFEVEVPSTAQPTEPYFLRTPRIGDLYHWPEDPLLRGAPFEPAELVGTARVELVGPLGSGVDQVALELEREFEYRSVSTTEGESRRPVLITPAVSLSLSPALAILPLRRVATDTPIRTGDTRSVARGDGGVAIGDHTGELQFSVELTTDSPEGASGTIRLDLPTGWRSVPESVPARLSGPGERRRFEFEVRPPAGVAPGPVRVGAAFVDRRGERHTRGYQLLEYKHIRGRPFHREAGATIQALDLEVAEGLQVGYIPGAGDAIPEALRELGIPVTIIEADELATADLSGLQTLILGIRAYEHRPELATQNQRLLEYVEGGGTLIVQYNQHRFSGSDLPPYPLMIARPHDRVTDETAPIRILEPEHPLFNWPNRISDTDFEGWVQERGLYLPREWDERYTPLISMNDPGEAPLDGGILVASHGKGTYIYTGLAFFRQLPAGVPGAYRLFANLVSLGAR